MSFILHSASRSPSPVRHISRDLLRESHKRGRSRATFHNADKISEGSERIFKSPRTSGPQNDTNSIDQRNVVYSLSRNQDKIELLKVADKLGRLAKILNPKSEQQTQFIKDVDTAWGQLESLLFSEEEIVVFSDQLKDKLAKKIAYIFLDCGKLASIASQAIAIECFQRLLSHLRQQENVTEKNVANIIFGLESMAQKNLLNGKVASDVINMLLGKLTDLGITPRGISNIFLSLKKLAPYIDGVIDVTIVNSLLAKFAHLTPLNAQDISSTILALGKMVQIGCLNEQIDIATMDTLLSALIGLRKRIAHDICDTLGGLGQLANANALLATALGEKYLVNLVEILKKMSLRNFEVTQALSSIVAFWTTCPCDIQTLKFLFQHTLTANTYVHPSLAAERINIMAAFKDFYQELSPLFNQFILAIKVPMRGFSQTIQNQFVQTLENLQDLPVWQSALYKQLQINQVEECQIEELEEDDEAEEVTQAIQNLIEQPADLSPLQQREPLPPNVLVRNEPVISFEDLLALPSIRKQPAVNAAVPSTDAANKTYPLADKNPIFIKIKNRDIDGLLAILDSDQTFLRKRSVANHPHQPLPLIAALKQKATAITSPQKFPYDELVQQFFEEIEIEALNQLIKGSQAIYFETILRKCSLHKRFQLAKAYSLHPLILHLKISELKKMILGMNGILEFYRDSDVTFRVVDALNIRLFESPQKRILTELRTILIDRAIEHHQAHCHVIVKLIDLKEKYTVSEIPDAE